MKLANLLLCLFMVSCYKNQAKRDNNINFKIYKVSTKFKNILDENTKYYRFAIAIDNNSDSTLYVNVNKKDDIMIIHPTKCNCERESAVVDDIPNFTLAIKSNECSFLFTNFSSYGYNCKMYYQFSTIKDDEIKKREIILNMDFTKIHTMDSLSILTVLNSF
jgi:hypothetical protein